MSRTMVVAAGIVAVLAWACAAPATQYTITDLGTLGGSNTWATGINNVGQIVGQSGEHAFLYSGGVMQDLGTLGGSWSFATSINDAGQVVGSSDFVGNVDRHAFLYSGGVMQDLGTLGGALSSAEGINNAGQVVGQARTGPTDHAFLYSGGVMQDLGTLGGAWSSAQGINNAGQVVGVALLTSGAQHAFLYSSGVMQDLGTLGWSSSALGMNSVGQVVGESHTTAESTPQHAFLYSNGVMHDLGTLGGTYGSAYSINNAGQIVGESSIAGNMAQHAFLYSGGVMTDLNSLIPANSGLTLAGARSINDRGQIAGYAWEPSGLAHAILLTPTSPPPAPQFHAVLIGVGGKGDTRGDEDAEAIFRALLGQRGVSAENLWLVTNPPDLDAVQVVLQEVIKGLRPGDQLMFYYAGHGYYDVWGDGTHPEPPVLLCENAKKHTGCEWNTGDEYLIVGSDQFRGLSDDVLTAWLSADPKMTSVRKLVVLDGCFSGGFWGRQGNEDDEGDLDKLDNVGFLAACAEDGLASTFLSWIPGVGGRGKFSWVLEKALTCDPFGFALADLNLDGRVSFEELRDTVGRLYTVEELGSAGLIMGFPWLETDVEVDLQDLGLDVAWSADFDTAAPMVPEPASLGLLAVGMGLLLARRRSRVAGRR